MINKVLTLFAVTLGAFTSFAQPACPTIQMSGSDVGCYGATDGSATVTVVTGGSGSYVHQWSNGSPFGGNTSSISSLAAGTYTVTVHDIGTGCAVVGAFVVGSPDPIVITETVSDVNCYGANTGAIDITVTGGTLPYSYTWTNSGGAVAGTPQDVVNQPADSYTVVVDASSPSSAISCTATKNFIISEPIEALQASGVVTDASCFNTPTGAIDVSVWGGTPPYAYSWDSGATTQDISGLTAGNYNLTVLDSKGCSIVVPFTVTQPTLLSGTISSTDVLCFGEATGSVTMVPTGGTLPYSYSWQNSTTLFAQNTASLFNVVAETYQVTVTDANGCTYTDNVVVNEPTLLTGSTVPTNVSCYGGNDGAIDLIVNGGSAPYTYVWENSVPTVITGTPQDLVSIPAETYTVTITDNNNCELILVQEITQPLTPISAETEVFDVLCYGENTGSINLTVNGGTQPFTYSWSSGQTTEDISSLLAGSYTYNILDANGCPLSGTDVVSQPAQPLTVTNIIQDVNCFGESNGSIDLTVTGGTAPYTYIWSNSTFYLSATGQDLIDYPADWYRYEVTDANGCKSIDTLTINEPPALWTTISGVDILCFGGNNGSVDLTVGGGVTPYAYLWNNGFVTEDISGLVAGYYEVTVTDANGCTIMDSITLTEPSDSLSYTYQVEDVLCKDGTDGEIDLDVAGGTIPYFYDWSNGDTVSQIVNLTAGWYEFLVTDNNGCTITDSIYVDEPDAVTLNEVITPVTCKDLSDGIIDITPTGGTVPYNFTWYNSVYALSAQTEDLVDYPADVYQLEIIDSNGCFYEMFLEIEEPDSLLIDYTYNVVSCAGGIDGNILVDITGGNPGYTTTWSNGATTEDLLNIPADIYQLTVVDTKGCTDSITVDVAQPDSVTMTFETTEVSCIDDHDGVAFAYPEGGNGGYYYLWSNGETNSVNSGLSNEWYTLTVTDVLGCTGTDSVYIPKNGIGCVDPVNAFSPNGDAYNDTWVIDNMELYPNADVQIFNKWGNLIHQQTGLYEPWDGTINGTGAPSAVYYWIINLNHPEREILKGNITIVR